MSNDLKRLKWFESVAAQTFSQEALVTEKDRDPTDIVLRRTRALLADLEKYKAMKTLAPLAKVLTSLEDKAEDVPVADRQARRAI